MRCQERYDPDASRVLVATSILASSVVSSVLTCEAIAVAVGGGVLKEYPDLSLTVPAVTEPPTVMASEAKFVGKAGLNCTPHCHCLWRTVTTLVSW